MTNPTKQWQDEAERVKDDLVKQIRSLPYYKMEMAKLTPEHIGEIFLKGCEFEAARNKWVNVKNELPKDRGYYLVYSSKTDDLCPVRVALFCRVNMGSSFEFVTVDRYEVITHWQPITLPTAPKSKI